MTTKPTKQKKILEQVDYWGKSDWANIGLISHNFGEDADWICQRRQIVAGAYYQQFLNIKDTKFNWIIKIWCKLNNL